MVDKPKVDIDHIEAGLAGAHGSHQRRTASCPPEAEYWAFLDDESQMSEGTIEHITNCNHCRSELVRILHVMSSADDEGADDSRVTDHLIAQKLKGKPAIWLRRDGPLVIPVRNPFETMGTYRSTPGDSISVSEPAPFGNLELTFVPIATDEIELLVRVIKTRSSPQSLEAELWRGAKILRSLPVESGQWTSLSRWPKGDYELIVTSGGTRQLEIGVRFL